MITAFGKVLRNIRIDRSELLLDMAKKLNVQPSFLSSVENGKKNVPKSWPQKINQLYSLNDFEFASLHRAASEPFNAVRFDLSGASSDTSNVVLEFAQRFDNLNQEKLISYRRRQQNDSGGS